MKLALLILLIPALLLIGLLSSTAHGAEYWCNSTNVSGVTNGTSPATGWKLLRDIPWTVWDGAGPKQGDTISLCAGKFTNDFINILVDPLYPAGVGITIRAATNAGYTGIVTWDNSFLSCLYGGITLNGSNNLSTNFIFQNGSTNMTACAVALQGPRHYVSYCGFSNINNAVSIKGSSTNGRVTHCWFEKVREDFAIELSGMNAGGVIYDDAFVANCRFNLNVISFSQGEGPDGIQGCPGLTTFSNYFEHTVGVVTYKQGTSYQHSDFIQCASAYQRHFSSEFVNPVDSAIDVGVGCICEQRIYNNVFRQTRDCGSPSFIRFYNNDGAINDVYNLLVANNLFVDSALNASGVVATVGFLNFGAGQPTHAITFSNVRIINNIFVNCGRSGGFSPFYVLAYTAPALADFGFDYNLFNAGSGGISSIEFAAAGNLTQPNPRTGAPSWTSYSAGSAANDFHLSGADVAARGQGTNSAAHYSRDKDFVTIAAFDLGPFQYVAPVTQAITLGLGMTLGNGITIR